MLSYLIQADAFISSGGVSVGERDVVKAAFFRRGEVDFYKVAMQPGMPQGFGQIEGKPYFGLPGNPVSVFVSFEIFVRPAILKMMGRTQLYRPEVTATLTEDVDGAEGQVAVRAGPAGAGRRRVEGDAYRAPRLQPHLDRRPRERPGDGTGRHRDGAGRLGGPRHGLPVLGGLRGGEAYAAARRPGSSRWGRRTDRTRGDRRVRRDDDPDASRIWWRARGRVNPIEAARIAGVMGVKRTPDLLPFCHPIAITGAEIVVQPDPAAGTIRVETTVRANDRTGVEMEALTAAAVAALSLYDTAKEFDRAARIDGLRLVAKSGGKSGDYHAG